jgi:hypothetical protein
MGRMGGSSARNKGGFMFLCRDNPLGFLGLLSSFQPSLRVSHEDLGSDFILEATNK